MLPNTQRLAEQRSQGHIPSSFITFGSAWGPSAFSTLGRWSVVSSVSSYDVKCCFKKYCFFVSKISSDPPSYSVESCASFRSWLPLKAAFPRIVNLELYMACWGSLSPSWNSSYWTQPKISDLRGTAASCSKVGYLYHWLEDSNNVAWTVSKTTFCGACLNNRLAHKRIKSFPICCDEVGWFEMVKDF